MVWAKLGTTTLSSTGDSVTVSSLTESKFIMILCNHLNSGYLNSNLQFNSDTGNNYSNRHSLNGGTDTQYTSVNYPFSDGLNLQSPQFGVHYIANYANKEKIGLGHWVMQDTTGAETAPQRTETTGKWANTSSAITTINTFNYGSGDYASDSNLSVLGSDGTLTATLQDGTIFEESDTNKSYIWNSSTTSWTQL